jgi:hypothetical protein
VAQTDIGFMNVKLNHNHEPDRRLNVRYPIQGQMVIETDQGTYNVNPVNLSFAGVQFKGSDLPLVHTPGTMRLKVEGLREAVKAEVRITRNQATQGAALFIVPHASLVHCIAWLAIRNQDEKPSCGSVNS